MERYSILGPATDEASCQEHGNTEIRDNQETLMKQEKGTTSFTIQGVEKIVSTIQQS